MNLYCKKVVTIQRFFSSKLQERMKIKKRGLYKNNLNTKVSIF